MDSLSLKQLVEECERREFSIEDILSILRKLLRRYERVLEEACGEARLLLEDPPTDENIFAVGRMIMKNTAGDLYSTLPLTVRPEVSKQKAGNPLF